MPKNKNNLKAGVLAHIHRHNCVLGQLKNYPLLPRIESQFSINKELITEKYNIEKPDDYWGKWWDEAVTNFEQRYRLVSAGSEYHILESLFTAVMAASSFSDFKWKTIILGLYDTSYSLLARLIQNSGQGTIFKKIKYKNKDKSEKRKIKSYPEIFTTACKIKGNNGKQIIPKNSAEEQPIPTFKKSKTAAKIHLKEIRNDFIHNERDSTSFILDGMIETCFLAIPFIVVVGLSEFGLRGHMARCRFISTIKWLNDSMLYSFSHYMVGKHQSSTTEHIQADTHT